jgi:hypothetical protein
MKHIYIKPRSHRKDQEEFYQLLTYTDDVDLNKYVKPIRVAKKKEDFF